MDKKNLMPIVAQPVNRITTGQLPESLAELSEEALSQLGEDASPSNSSASVLALAENWNSSGKLVGSNCYCSVDGDDAE